jgi:predicted DNA-binding transcriptional regulator AlpA
MGKKVGADEQVGAHEIAQCLGVARPQVIHEWRQRHQDFPKPIAMLKTALIWNWREVATWAVQTGRDSSRTRK